MSENKGWTQKVSRDLRRLEAVSPSPLFVCRTHPRRAITPAAWQRNAIHPRSRRSRRLPAPQGQPTGTSAELRLDKVYHQVREILAAARDRAWQAVNTVMVDAYWEVGRVIVEDEQAGKGRAGYGKRVLEGLAERLQAEFGKGYDPSNLRNMRAFFLTYPNS